MVNEFKLFGDIKGHHERRKAQTRIDIIAAFVRQGRAKGREQRDR